MPLNPDDLPTQVAHESIPTIRVYRTMKKSVIELKGNRKIPKGQAIHWMKIPMLLHRYPQVLCVCAGFISCLITFAAETAANQKPHMKNTPVNAAARENVAANPINPTISIPGSPSVQLPPLEPTSSAMLPGQLELPLFRTCSDGSISLAEELRDFCQFGGSTVCVPIEFPTARGLQNVPGFINVFWTVKQRQSHSLHRISYRACFKPELARFFIERSTKPGDIVLDPFSGRGTVALESAFLGRVAYSNDLNPVSYYFTAARLNPPTPEQVFTRLHEISLSFSGEIREDLLVFYHPETLCELQALRHYFLSRRAAGEFDNVDLWLCMVCMNRLTGQSDGFFSVITMPPTFAVSVRAQTKINEKKLRSPEKREVRSVILKKSTKLLSHVNDTVRRVLAEAACRSKVLIGPADNLSAVPSGSVSLAITSPPFLNVVNYAADNWLRCWFVGVDSASLDLTVTSRLDRWREAMTRALRELHRVLKPGGRVAFEVGEIRRGRLKLERSVLSCGVEAGFVPELVMINAPEEFAKQSHCNKITNNVEGTNTNRIVLFKKVD